MNAATEEFVEIPRWVRLMHDRFWFALSIRMYDRYKLWPGNENAAPQTPRTWRSVVAEYVFFATVGVMSVVVLLWVVQ